MSVRGTYQQIGDFLTNVGTLQRIVAPINVSLNPSPRRSAKDQDAASAALDARFEIQTYVARTAPTAKAGPAAAGAGAFEAR